MNKYINKNKGFLLLSLLCSMFAAIFAVRVQFLKGDVLDSALQSDFNISLQKGTYLGIFIMLEMGFYYLYDIAKAKFVVESLKAVRRDFFYSLIHRSYPCFLKMSQGEYLAKYTNEMDLLENQFFLNIPMLGEILIKILSVSISLFVLDYRIALITLFLLTTPLYVPKLVEKHLQDAQTAYVKQFEEHLKLVNDWLKGLEIIKNFSIEKKILERFNLSNDLTMSKSLKKKQISYLTRTVSAILSYMSHYIILTFAAYLVLRGEFTAGKFFVAIGMIDQLSYPIISLSYFIQELVSVEPVNRTISGFIESSENKIETDQLELDDVETITFKNVNFAYEDRQILEDINMVFEKDYRYLLCGQSGSGKTTSMNLLLDYYEIHEGKVLLDGYPVEQVGNLNKLIAIMRQDAVLFQDTLRNNLSMYQEISDEKLIQVLKEVGLEKFSNQEKLDYLIEEDGVNLSGGEKRRVALARVLLRQTPVLVLDEPLANLDAESAASIEDLLLAIGDRMVIVISHQFSPSKISQFKSVYRFG